MASLDTLRYAPWLTRERVLRWSLAFVLMSAILVTAHIVTHTAVQLTSENGEQLGIDFINYWSGARFASEQPVRAYDLAVFDAFQKSVVGSAAVFKYYVYPPVAMMLSLPLANLSFVWALVAWVGLGAGFCLWSLSRLLGWRMAALATFGAPAACLNLLTGQNGYFTAGLLGTGLMVLDRRPVLAGMLFGLLSYKPHFGLLLPVALIFGGHWRAFTAAAATVVLLVVGSIALLGADVWLAFLHMMAVQRQIMEIGVWGWHRIPTIFAAMRMAGAGESTAYAAQIASAALAAAIVALVWRARCPLEVKAATLVIATFVSLPYAQDYDMVVLIFAAGWLLNQALANGFLPWERLTLAMLLVLPIVAMPLSKWTGVQIGPIVLWAMLALSARRALAPDSGVAAFRPANSPVSSAAA
jgi:hypothetical protein